MTTTTLERIRRMCVDEGECWIWTGALSEAGLPRTAKSSVRRVVWQVVRGPIEPRFMVSCTCGEKRCVNPDHLVLRTRSTIVKITARDTSARQKRARTMAVIARAKAKLTPEAVLDIRSSTDTCKQAAARHGVHFSLISKVRRGDAWKDFSSPFAGLGARP